MADYGMLFNSGGPLMANPNPQPPPQQGTSVESILNNPRVQQVAFELAAALDPEGFGGKLARAGLAMRQGQSAAEGFGKANEQGTKNSQLPTQPQQPQPTQTTANTNVAATAKQYTTLGTILKNAGSVDPSIVPSGYTKTFIDALSANSGVAQNPTQPVGSMFTGVPTGQAVQEPVQNQAPPLELDPALAGTLTPEIIANIYSHSIAKEKQSIDTAKAKWDMDPQRFQEELFKAVAPGVAQAHAIAKAEIEKIKAVGEFTSQRAEDFITNNPVISSKMLPNGMTVAQFVRLNASNPNAAENITNMLNVQKDYEAAIYSANMHYKAARENADAQGRSDEFFKLTNAFQEYNKQANSKLLSIEEYNAMPPAERIMSGAIPRTKEAEETIRIAKQMRDLIGVQLYGPAYGEMVKSVQKLDAITGGGQNEVADPTKLKQLMEEDKRKSRGASRSFSNNPIYDLFNPTGGPS